MKETKKRMLFRQMSLFQKTALLFFGLLALCGVWIIMHSANVQYAQLRSQAADSMASTLQRLTVQIDNMMDLAQRHTTSIITNDDILLALQTDLSSPEEYSLHFISYKRFISTLQSLATAYYNVLNMQVFVDNRLLYAHEGNYLFSLDQVEGESWYAALQSGAANGEWFTGSEFYRDDTYVSSEAQAVSKPVQLAYVRKITNGNHFYGVVLVRLRSSLIEQFFSSEDLSPDGALYLTDAEGVVLYASADAPAGRGERLSQADDDTLIAEETLSEEPAWSLRYVAPFRANLSLIRILNLNSVWPMMVCLLMACAVMYLYFMWLVRRIANINRHLKQLEENKGNPGLIRSKYSDELASIENQYDLLSIRLDALLQEVFDAGAKVKESEMLALQSQINPHFLYNTLDMINWMAIAEGARGVSKAVSTLGQFFRTVLDGKTSVISIRDEITLTRKYIEIQTMRLHDNLRVTWSVPESMMDVPIMKLTLQPFIENSIKHGFRQSEERINTIVISGAMEDGFAVMEITDNGDGIRAENPDDSLPFSKTGSGIENVQTRLRLFGRDSSVTVQGLAEGGVRVRLRWNAQPKGTDGPAGVENC